MMMMIIIMIMAIMKMTMTVRMISTMTVILTMMLSWQGGVDRDRIVVPHTLLAQRARKIPRGDEYCITLCKVRGTVILPFLRSFQLVSFQAKVIGAPQAEDKLNYINALVRGKFDFNASNKEELAAANKELEKEDVKLFFVDGDVCTNALLAVAHDHLLACDLVYGRSDGGFLSISKEEFQEFKDEHLSLRLFKYLICNKPNSPNGYLATYRCHTRNTSLSCRLRERRKKRRERKIVRRERARI